jgi:hypothetical protein
LRFASSARERPAVSVEKILGHFREQAMYCDMFGSPFTGALMRRMADDIEADGPMASFVSGWPTSPRADALALRFTGVLHEAALSGRDKKLGELYPANSPDWSMDAIWPAALGFLKREDAWVRAFVRSAPQTNETRRSIALLAAFLSFAQTWDGPTDFLEIGASAGLNLNWDQFAYRPATWSWGDNSPVVIDTDWNGAPPPIDAKINVRDKAGCDLNPLDIRDVNSLLRLKSYVWADQPDRLARFDGAVALALRNGTRIEQASAEIWLADKLAARATDAATIVYHSVFFQYPPRPVREAIAKVIETTGAAATKTAPVAWVRLEPEALFDGPPDSARMVIDMITWPGGARRILGYTDGHVRGVYVA